MSQTELLVAVAGMALVTYIPRMLPMVTLTDLDLSPFWRRFLHYIPAAALSALLFPGILEATGSPPVAAAGGISALILALKNFGLLAVVLISILTVFSLQMLFL
ncbi:AzlD domain-containing protein [Halarsenatibacter silvermanii]|uniref:Branched-chain amino acid transport protein n=1 Tax=Halarsenatibacter silvermanii TaxID=321763 RepID=A0A1G9QP94_9FIRM|nr:AzlD domain-containing protein [Halarsenatibacter silvermanii]SDM12824.1 Branched-chain amino acid transport protein [Halarsenatibacter silvermanii]